MSYTVSTGKLVAALVRADGEIVYVLFERTHESNVFPQTPNWNCICIGTYSEVMLRVFRLATSCEGGSLKGSGNRDIKPENYIAGWQRELAEPVRMDDCNITLKVGGQYSSLIKEDKVEDVISVLRQIGRNELADALRNDDRVVISLYQDVDVVLALFGVDKMFSAWRVLNHSCTMTMRHPEFGPVPRIENSKPPMVRVLAAKGSIFTEMVVQVEDGVWQQWGADYSALGKYMLEVVYPCEMKHTGCHKRLIANFRNACSTAQEVPDSTKLKLIRNAEDASSWNRENFDKLVSKLGGVSDAIEFDCTVADLKAVENGMYELTHLQSSQIVWNIQTMPTQPVSQLSLLAA
jgi:hypothetical protein